VYFTFSAKFDLANLFSSNYSDSQLVFTLLRA